MTWCQKIAGLGSKVRSTMPSWVMSQSEHWHRPQARAGVASTAKPRTMGGAYANTIKKLKLIPANTFVSLHAATDNATPVARHHTCTNSDVCVPKLFPFPVVLTVCSCYEMFKVKAKSKTCLA